jgi:putative hydrolase of the HAD superfamily
MMTQKILIWDLGDTLFSTHTLALARVIGLTDFVLYQVLDRQSPADLKAQIFTILTSFEEPAAHQAHQAYGAATNGGKVLPLPLLKWLAGESTGAEICDKASSSIAELDKGGYFKSKRQKRLIARAISAIFNPVLYARFMRPIGSGLKLLRECAEYHQRHKFFILSNWDRESFVRLAASNHGKRILEYFNPTQIIISGNIGVLKPNPYIYQYFITRFNVDPRDCVLIDDQPENIQAAQDCGMIGLLLENQNYTKLKEDLKQLKVL